MDTRLMAQLLWQLGQLRQRDHWTRPQLEAHQVAALQRLRAYAYANSPFYQRFHQGLTDRPLHDLPVLTKAMVMEHFDELVTDRSVQRAEVEAFQAATHGDERFRGRYWVSATSGSTGRPGLFLFDRAEWTAILTSFARAHEWAGLTISLTHRMTMASVASTTPCHMSAQVGASLRSWWMPALRLAASEPLPTIVEQLNAWQPEMVVAYASMARLLADEQAAGRLQIAPHLFFTSSEVLTAETRRRIEAVWGQRLFNQYAATESGGLAAECVQHRGLHLFEDLVICESVDGDNRPVPPGVYGEKVLITVLASRTLPLIRYEVTDSVRLATTACPCGRPFRLLDGIQGRAEDILHLPAAAGGQVAVHPLVFHRVLDTTPASGWQVVQTDDGVRVVLSGMDSPVNDERLVEVLQRELAAQGAVVPAITVERVSAIPRGAGDKAPLIRAAGHRARGAANGVAPGQGR